MAFVMVLSYSRDLYLRFFLDAWMENFLRGHIGAFNAWCGLPRVLLYDNLKSAVLKRQGDAIRFYPTLLAFAGHYRFEPRPVAVARGTHTHVRRTLNVRVELDHVRLFDGAQMIASHRRSYERDAQIENPQHLKTLEQFKRQARQHRGANSLTKAMPACRLLLTRAAERGENLGALTAALLRLLDRYGAAELQSAVEHALRTGSAHTHTVRAALERQRVARGAPPPIAMNLPEHVRRTDTPVQPCRTRWEKVFNPAE